MKARTAVGVGENGGRVKGGRDAVEVGMGAKGAVCEAVVKGRHTN